MLRSRFEILPLQFWFYFFFSQCTSAANQIKDEKCLSLSLLGSTQQTDLIFGGHSPCCSSVFGLHHLLSELSASLAARRSTLFNPITRIYDCKVHFCKITLQFKGSVDLWQSLISSKLSCSLMNIKFKKYFDYQDIGRGLCTVVTL